MATYRWVGSGNTGSTSANIFNWNNASNWRKFVTSGTLKYFAGTTVCPGNGDVVVFGNDFSFAGITNMEYTKSPCLFGGFVGSAAGGTWAGAAAPYGATLTSSLLAFKVDPIITDEEYGNGNYNFTYGRAGGSDNIFTDMPIGGGLTGNISCLRNLEWIQQNYPNMGVSVSITGGDYVFTVPAGFTSTWNNLTLKVRDSITINNFGIWARTGTIGIDFVTSYKQLVGGTGSTGAVSVNTTCNIKSMRDVNISGGAFLDLYVNGIRDHGPGVNGGDPAYYPKAPLVNITNLYANTIYVPLSSLTTIGETVRFKKLSARELRITGYEIPQPLLRGPRKLIVNGSGSVTQVNAVLYPGNSANTNNEKSEISVALPFFDPRLYENGSEIEESIKPLQNAYDWAHLSMAHQRYGLVGAPGDTGPTTQYWHDAQTIFGESSVVAYGQNPYTQELIIGQADGVTSVDIDTIVIAKDSWFNRDYEIPVLKFEGSANVNSVYLGNYSIFDCNDSTNTVNIGELKLSQCCLVSLDRSENNFQFGIRSSSGTTGGIMAMNETEMDLYGGHEYSNEYQISGRGIPTGKLSFPSSDEAGGIRLFNVNTKKAGAIQVTETTVAEIAQVSGTNKKG
jgi:hypothetical protein